MKTFSVLTAGLAATVVAAAGDVPAASAQGLPPAVRTAIQGMDADCRDGGGTPGDRSGLIKSGDWNGDGLRDWAIDGVAYVCNGAAGLFSGSGGGSVDVYAGAPGGGSAPPVFFGAFGATADGGKLWLSVGGVNCGQRVTDRMSRSEYEHCERPIAWVNGKFDMAPVSAIRPLRPDPAYAPTPAPAPTSAPARTTGVSAAWLTGAWVATGHVCDSGAPEIYDADGTMASEGMEGRWRLEGDVLNATWHALEEDGSRGPEQSARHRITRLGQDRLTMTPLGRGAPVTMTRCT